MTLKIISDFEDPPDGGDEIPLSGSGFSISNFLNLT
jgi:hypothetical protein